MTKVNRLIEDLKPLMGWSSYRRFIGLLGKTLKRKQMMKQRSDKSKIGIGTKRRLLKLNILPLALASGGSEFTAQRISLHLTTNAWAIEQFGFDRVTIGELEYETGPVKVEPKRHLNAALPAGSS